MQGALAGTVVFTAVATVAPSALADPPPSNASQALQKLNDLNRQAEILTQQWEKANDDEQAKKGELDQANAAAAQAQQSLNQAQAVEEQSRGKVDALTNASFQGARLNTLSALLSNGSPNGFLDRASMLDELAKSSDDTIQHFQAAVNQAQTAEQQAQTARARSTQAEAQANQILGQINTARSAMQAQITQVQAQYNSLSASDRQSLEGPNIIVGLLGGSGAAVEAVNAALSKRGDPYVWGATGPSSFDCSGLVQWAYKQAGVNLPRSTYSQVSAGQSVSQSDLQPGDLLFFFGNSHVGIYIGNGNMIHAPQTGEDVKVVPYKYVGQPSAIRRVSG